MQKTTSDIGLLVKKLLRLSIIKMNNPIEKWAKDLNRNLTKEDTWLAICIQKDGQQHMSLREFQIKTMRCHDTSIRMAKIQKSDNPK